MLVVRVKGKIISPLRQEDYLRIRSKRLNSEFKRRIRDERWRNLEKKTVILIFKGDQVPKILFEGSIIAKRKINKYWRSKIMEISNKELRKAKKQI